uniref:Uncharacterized protein n=1 Tax=Rhizophora mucronata TaxID=61149 RepID=A0A2P2NLE4_RHIMU
MFIKTILRYLKPRAVNGARF